MRTISINIAGRPEVGFQVAQRPDDSIYVLLGVRKCGSSIMNNMLHDLARINERHYVDVGGAFFQAGIPEREWRTDPAIRTLLRPGNLYGGFRSMPLVFANVPRFRSARKILLVRDPRDALVSEYFSTAYTHSLPEPAPDGKPGAREELLADREITRAKAIGDFVLAKARLMNRVMMEYADVAADPLTKLFHYEAVILDKRPWLAAMAAHFGWNGGSPAFVDGMMEWADRIPSQENAQAFIRKVVPGDHKEKLTPDVIDKLDVALSPCMSVFGY